NGANTYRPEQPVTREHLAIFLIKALGVQIASAPSSPSFIDVPPDRFSYAYVEEFVSRGLASRDEYFFPEAQVTREQAVLSIMKALNLEEPAAPSASHFRDVEPSRPGYALIEEAARRGIATADAQGCFRPDDYITRGEIAAMLVRAFNL
ncbi:MAG TPA: S-layer homology domain-containing protein, partial [Blastocatellia bacterium]|nr:S-layer homology domain-containing protein [Blastocatellia bacterium]